MCVYIYIYIYFFSFNTIQFWKEFCLRTANWCSPTKKIRVPWFTMIFGRNIFLLLSLSLPLLLPLLLLLFFFFCFLNFYVSFCWIRDFAETPFQAKSFKRLAHFALTTITRRMKKEKKKKNEIWDDILKWQL